MVFGDHGEVLAHSCGLLGRSWALWGWSWGVFSSVWVRSWARKAWKGEKDESQRHTPISVVFFAACGVFLAALGRSWVALGRSWVALGILLAALGSLLGALGSVSAAWDALGTRLDGLGAPSAAPGALLAAHEGAFGRPGHSTKAPGGGTPVGLSYCIAPRPRDLCPFICIYNMKQCTISTYKPFKGTI